jgi:peptidoglycan/LPS O-acetylase OafA/YrhL
MTIELRQTASAALDAERSPPVASVSPDRTATGKQHFEVLDGLRGSAALFVVLFHIQGIMVDFDQKRLLLHHAYMAVDFFFALSGFVIGYAYDDRWGKMTLTDFIKARLIRLHPLVVLGVLLGFASYLFDPFAGASHKTTWSLLLLALALGALALPTRPLPDRWDDTHTLDGPAWTLFQEYLGNLAYALVLRRLGAISLGVMAIIAGVVLAGCAITRGYVDAGSGWTTFWMAPVRLSAPFLTGLWLYRVRDRLPRLEVGWLPLTLVLAAIFILPSLPEVRGVKLNGVYEAFCVLVLFPIIVACGAHSKAGAGLRVLCKASGRISYPLYITHFPFLYIWMSYVARAKPSAGMAAAIGLALLPPLLLVGWAALKLWDEPIRSRLRQGRA